MTNPGQASKTFQNSKLRFVILAFPVMLLVFFIFRLVFILHFQGWHALFQEGMGRALFLGLKFDARLSMLLLMPVWLLWRPGRKDARRKFLGLLLLALALVIYITLVIIYMMNERDGRNWLFLFLAVTAALRWICPQVGIRSSSLARWFWRISAAFAVGATLLAYLVDFGVYAYIHNRLNGTLLMFLENTGISLRMVWESYPIVWLTLAFAILLAASLVGLSRLLGEGEPLLLPRKLSLPLHGGVTLLMVLIMWGRIGQYPLVWAEVFSGRNAFQSHAALNPLLFFLETRRDMDGGYDLEQVRRTHARMARYFGIPVVFDDGMPTLRRVIEPRPLVRTAANIVFIQLESFAGFKTGILGNPADPTPFFDNLCRNGLFFDRAYVVMENTSRSMFATLFGIPDVSSLQNATRNPLLVDQHSALHSLSGYDQIFALGGSASWAQIRGVLKNNFPALILYEQESWRGPTIDVWGISDLDLLLETNERLIKRQKPFWVLIQTSGNHPPYTIPKQAKDFQKREVDEAFLRRAGFTGNTEFNSIRFIDYCLKRYFEAAQKEEYFRNTIFVLWADHGVPRGSNDARFGDLNLATHHIPLLIYAPGLNLAARRIHTITTQMDILPTLISLLGHRVETQTLGKDALDPEWEEQAAAFTFTTFRRPPRTGLLQGEWYLNVEPQGQYALLRLDDTVAFDHSLPEAARAKDMADLCQGFYAWSRFLLSHNKPRSAK